MGQLFEVGDVVVQEPTREVGCKLVPCQDSAFFPGMQAHIEVDGIAIGIIVELHPEVLGSSGFEVNLPTSAFELNVEPVNLQLRARAGNAACRALELCLLMGNYP